LNISQLIDSTVFVLIAFYGVFETAMLLEILITTYLPTYLLKFVVAAADTPFVYQGKNIFKKNKFWME